MKVEVSKIVGAVGLTVLGVIAMHYNYSELAGVAVGALGTWILRNGVNASKKKEET